MSIVWVLLICISIIVAFCTGNPGIITSGVMEQGKVAVENMLTLIGMMCFWSGIFNIFSKTTAINSLSKAINNVTAKLFKKEEVNKEALEYMSMNISTNILGVGNASTVNGIKAITELQKINSNKDSPNDTMTTFVVINAASIQLIPTSMITMRAMYGSVSPASILVPVWIVTIVALFAGLTTIKILNKWV